MSAAPRAIVIGFVIAAATLTLYARRLGETPMADAPATALGFFNVIPPGAHCGFIVLPAAPKVFSSGWDASCVAAQQYAAINPIKGFC